jgi:hypothetical protein
VQSGSDAVFTEVSSIFRGRLFAQRVLGLNRLSGDPDLVRFCLRGSMLVPAGTYRREAVQAVGGYRDGLWQAEDFDFHVRLAASGISYTVLDEPLVVTHLRPEGRSQNQVEVWTSALQAVAALAEELAPEYRSELSETAARCGSTLFRLGAIADARRAFELADRLGPPAYVGRSPWYRWVAHKFKAEAAERMAVSYRALVPHTIRARMSRRST